ncbi:short chain dehydrogenase [Microbacterium sp. cf046]|uniref:SDR family NAD(P)-dependent oxidoreductase n=1 Tax=Microbacterium sp. cf046 TaxID=1761803 RepID=UPI0008E98EFD|nr:SDR family NAD(P)-dependent oxidoreductase [Microbacterium sp. cf046]SFR94026.1 short chain dehydrogenase [Microbacterium sp. cf046]
MSAPAESAAAEGRVVLIAGATSASGLAVTRALVQAGARVIAVGRDADKIDAMAGALRQVDGPTIRTEVCDLIDEFSVRTLAEHVHAAIGPVDGVVNLVGGWRGGGGLAGQSDEDFRFLERSFTALRHVSRAFDEDLRTSSAGRLAIVSSTAVARPLAGGANYAAVKAASEAWTRAVAQGFAKSARDAGSPLSSAAAIFRVKSLEGLEDVLAEHVVRLWTQDAASVNDAVITIEG